ncbi:MAG TPA: serine--tRNA ligase [Candidatus Marinimicrobia bacterium]|nr:serine--tRNA ligase [Candidatus Neomarinimicrobiota bacterium]
MLSLKYIRENTAYVQDSLIQKKSKVSIPNLLENDSKRRNCLKEVELLRAERNKVSASIAELKKAGKDAQENILAMRDVSSKIKEVEIELRKVEEIISNEIYFVPNVVHSSTPVGKDESSNVFIKEWGEAPKFSFTPKDHLILGEDLQLFDFKRAVKMAGSGFPLYTGVGAKLERALINFMLDFHISKHNYTELFPPFLAHADAMRNTGQLPKFKDDMYQIPEDSLYCIPTAEVPVTNIHQGEIIPESELPKKYAAYSACFRREAGSYGKDTKGLIRVHQFNKVELVKFVHPDESYKELETLLENAEAILQALGLHYRVLELCSGDLSFSAAKCYDLEVWSPAENKYLEVSSCSNFENFQARRSNIRYRNNSTGKSELIHTLNGSGVATPRLMVALLETYQQEDGTIKLPAALHPFMNMDIISIS